MTEQTAADRRARESLQLKIYALAEQAATGRLPAAVELRFLESGLVGRCRLTDADLSEAETADPRRRRGNPRAAVRGDPGLPGVPLLPVQSDLPQHRDPGVNVPRLARPEETP